jgi:tetrahydromethanopterin S-methyltransferase subunit G
MSESQEVRMARLEEKTDSILLSINDLKESLNSHVMWESEKYNELHGRFDALDAKYDSKYAGKWVEKVAIGVGIAFAGGVISLVMAFTK